MSQNDNTSEPPVVSIVVPAFNISRFLPSTVRSIQGQTFGNWELVIVDDGSTDDTLSTANDIASRDPRIRVIEQTNLGMGAARNKGYRAADPRSKYVIFLDADDVWDPDLLASMVGNLSSQPEYPAVSCAHYDIDQDGNRFPEGAIRPNRRGERYAMSQRGLRALAPDEPDTLLSLLTWNGICTPGCVLIRRSIYDQTRGFAENRNIVADWAMWIEIARFGPIRRIGRAMLGYRRHASNMSGNARYARFRAYNVRAAVLRSDCFGRPEKHACIAGLRAWEHDDVCDKLHYIAEDIANGNLADAFRQTKYLYGHLARYLSGRPHPTSLFSLRKPAGEDFRYSSSPGPGLALAEKSQRAATLA